MHEYVTRHDEIYIMKTILVLEYYISYNFHEAESFLEGQKCYFQIEE